MTAEASDAPSSDRPPERPALRPAARLWPWVTLATVLFALANAGYSAWDQDWTYDEPFNLEWCERLLTSRNGEREIPHFNSKTPVTLPGAVARMAARQTAAAEPWLRLASRLPSVLWLFALLLVTFVLGRRLFGPTAGYLATTAAALDPNLVAHGSLATVDVAYAVATLLTVAAALRFTENPSAPRASMVGLALGLALATKFTAVLLLPALFLLPALKRPARGQWQRWMVGALVVAAVATATVCAAYLFLEVGTPLGARRWLSAPLARLASAWPGLRLPVPAAFLTGLDVSLAAERGDWNVVILGRSYPHGVWFYFLVLWLLKTPLLVLLAEIYGLWRAARARLLTASVGGRLLLLTLLLHLVYFSLLYRTQLGYRYVLMCVPLAYLLAAAGLAPLAARPWAPAAAGAAVLIAVLENALFVGNPLAFTSAAVWPKRQAFRLLADSNLDWGQHDQKIHRWLAEHPELPTRLNPPHFLPGHNTFNVNEVAGVSDFERHRFLRENADPGGHIGHTHVWFEVGDDLFDRFLETKRRLIPTPATAAACPAGLAYQALPTGSPLTLSLPDRPPAASTWTVCVSTRQGADLGLFALRGQLWLGLYRAGAPCDGEGVAAGQELWHRLTPGTHALCLTGLPERKRIPHPVEGRWLVRNGEVRLHLGVGSSPALAHTPGAPPGEGVP